MTNPSAGSHTGVTSGELRARLRAAFHTGRTKPVA